MLDLKELLKQEKEIWFKVEKCDKVKFLKFFKEQHCKWINGKEIDIKNDKITPFMGINSNLELGFVSAICWCSDLKNKIRKTYHINDFFQEELNV